MKTFSSKLLYFTDGKYFIPCPTNYFCLLYLNVLFENNHAQLLFARLVTGLFGLGDALCLDGAVIDGGPEFGGVDDAGADDTALFGDVDLHADLAFLVYGGADVVDHAAGASAVADTAAVATACARA